MRVCGATSTEFCYDGANHCWKTYEGTEGFLTFVYCFALLASHVIDVSSVKLDSSQECVCHILMHVCALDQIRQDILHHKDAKAMSMKLVDDRQTIS